MAHVVIRYNNTDKDSVRDLGYEVNEPVTLETEGRIMKTSVVITPVKDNEDTQGTATADTILAPYTAWVNGSEVTGNIPTITPDEEVFDDNVVRTGDDVKVTITIPEGYYDSDKVIEHTYTDLLPDISPDATVDWILSGKKAYSDTGAVLEGRMTDNSNGDTETSSLTINNETGTVSLEGYYKSGSAVTATPGTITSGTPTLDSLKFKNLAAGYDAYISVDPPVVNTTGYQSSTVGTKNGVTRYTGTSAEVPAVQVTTTVNSDTFTPTISKEAISITNVTDAASGAATTTAPTSGVYVKVSTDNTTKTATANATTGVGYSDGIANHYSVIQGTGTFTTNSTTSYVPITEANVATVTTCTYTIPTVLTTGVEMPITVTTTQGSAGWVANGAQQSQTVTNIPVYVGPFAD